MSEYWVGTPNYNNGNDGIQFLFPHWTCGGFDVSVATLQNPAREASANYVIEEDRVAQLVNEGDTSWHCGNSWYNHRSISYELVGWPGYPPTEGTLDTCARMMAEASRNYFGGAALVLGENVLLHRMVSSTACPGETDINRLLQLANGYLGGGVPTPAPAPAPASPPGRAPTRGGGTKDVKLAWHGIPGASTDGGRSGSWLHLPVADFIRRRRPRFDDRPLVGRVGTLLRRARGGPA